MGLSNGGLTLQHSYILPKPISKFTVIQRKWQDQTPPYWPGKMRVSQCGCAAMIQSFFFIILSSEFQTEIGFGRTHPYHTGSEMPPYLSSSKKKDDYHECTVSLQLRTPSETLLRVGFGGSNTSPRHLERRYMYK